jgi:hypothetical protein
MNRSILLLKHSPKLMLRPRNVQVKRFHSNDLKPSENDIKLGNKLRLAGMTIGVMSGCGMSAYIGGNITTVVVAGSIGALIGTHPIMLLGATAAMLGYITGDQSTHGRDASPKQPQSQL